MKYGLIGGKLGHSLSPLIHSEIFKITGHQGEYALYEITADKLCSLSGLAGFNVTIPYKEAIIPFCERLDESAAAIGAVNCVSGKVGFNTDLFGFEKSVELLGADLKSRVCLLGFGGAGKMVAHAVKKAGGELTIATRSNINQLKGEFDLLVNSTPVGMFPNTAETPISFENISAEFVLDLIYNPAETKLLSLAKARKSKTMNGLVMLVWQAVKSHEIWYGAQLSDDDAGEIIKKLTPKPIYLYGFMGCGKSYIAEKSGLNYIDLDSQLGDIPKIFAEHGEQYFRSLEFSALKTANADIISLGGGALTNPEAAKYAKENAVVVFIDTGFEVCYERIKNDPNRPLAASKTKEELLALYNSRLAHYREAADFTIKGDETCSSITQKLKQWQAKT
jgi:shikimate dehydrogenase